MRCLQAHIKFDRGGAYGNFCHVFGPNPYESLVSHLWLLTAGVGSVCSGFCLLAGRMMAKTAHIVT